MLAFVSIYSLNFVKRSELFLYLIYFDLNTSHELISWKFIRIFFLKQSVFQPFGHIFVFRPVIRKNQTSTWCNIYKKIFITTPLFLPASNCVIGKSIPAFGRCRGRTLTQKINLFALSLSKRILVASPTHPFGLPWGQGVPLVWFRAR